MAVFDAMPWQTVPVAVVAILGASILGKCIYNVAPHPLCSYPGPFWWSATRLPWLYHEIKGDLHTVIADLHVRYGQTVRIAPDELSYTQPGAWKTIYGHRAIEMEKNLKGAGILPPILHKDQAKSIVTAERHHHLRMRKTLSYAFSEKALREQEGFLQSYVDRPIRRLRETSKTGPQNLVDWFNFTTFDVIGDMSFGEPFGCLENSQLHTWVANIFNGIKVIPYFHVILYFNIQWLALKLVPPSLWKAKMDSDADAYSKVDKRIAQQSEVADRRDFLDYILKQNDDKGMTRGEMQETAVVLIIAESETTATLLSGIMFLTLRRPDAYERLVYEVRSAFDKESQITMTSIQGLRYMNAVIQESFRLYPPAPSTFPRVVPGKGEVVEGKWVPGGTTVGVHQWSANHDSHNFHRPNDFLPERFLPNDLKTSDDAPAGSFENDQPDAIQPFSYGPRDCIGKSLAYAELRLILTKLLWNFDVKLAPESDNPRWITGQKTALLWEKLPLFAELTDIRH